MTNEHAYPHDFSMEPCKGLTKREYFAGLIYASMTASEQWEHQTWAVQAEHAVKAADALIEELRK